jgi:predicted unusual protein kinase regulating ubiquinone biosynthesis (AarF/ABC1/UbiB family)
VLRACARAASKAPAARPLPIRAVVDDLGACIERQLDFRRETASNRPL